MNYIYNIKVNMQNSLLNFYEWNNDDNIEIINKLPLVVVKDKDYINILNMCIKLDKPELIKFELSNNMCIFTNLFDCVCVKFSNIGIIDKISKLTLVEEDDVLDEIKNKKVVDIKYNIINKNNNYNFLSRNESKILNSIINYIESKKESNEIIDYLYYEWFKNKKSNNKYEELLSSISKEYSDKHEYLYNLIQLIEMQNV